MAARINKIDRISVGIQVLVERQRNALAARVLIHADEAPQLRVVVSGPEVNQPAGLIQVFPVVAMADPAGRVV